MSGLNRMNEWEEFWKPLRKRLSKNVKVKGEKKFRNDMIPEEHKMKCLNCGKVRR